jgi:hypothetical protein
MISCILSTYGLKLVTASCAFFNLAAATIFMALVICRVEATDAMRVRISFKFAIYQFLVFRFQVSSLSFKLWLWIHGFAQLET